MFIFSFRRLLSTVLVISLSMIACSPLETAVQPSAPQPSIAAINNKSTPIKTIEKPVAAPTIKDFQLLVRQAYPTQVLLSLNLLDNCQTIADIQQNQQADKITVALMLESSPTQTNCSSSPTLIPLNMQGLRSGSYLVEVNGISHEFEWIQEF